MVYGLIETQEGFPAHGIDPVIHAGPLKQPLPRYIMFRQIGQLAVIHAHMPVSIEDRFGLLLLSHPLFSQRCIPQCRLAGLLTQQFQLLA